MWLDTQDQTLKRNYIQRYQFLIQEYETVKDKTHPLYRYAGDFYKAHGIDRRTFRKYYVRFKQSGAQTDLLPRKRGPKWKSRRTLPFIENKVIELRNKGMNRYEIVSILKPSLKRLTPSPSGVYNIMKRNGLNRLTTAIKVNRRRIIKTKSGELAHIDAHYLAKGVIGSSKERLYIVCVIDDCTRVAWAQITADLKALTVMFAALRCFNMLADSYNIRFAEALTDNGPEMGTRQSSKKDDHPFERMLMELGIKHRYTRPYRPQTNGKVERFWRTLDEDLLAETRFDSLEHLAEELLQYLYYYNHKRPHQALGGKTPVEMAENCPRIM